MRRHSVGCRARSYQSSSSLDNSDAPNDYSFPVSALFFKRFLKRPFQIASIVPSSRAMVERVASKMDFNRPRVIAERSEEHTSELQSRSDLVCRLLLEKKKKIKK